MSNLLKKITIAYSLVLFVLLNSSFLPTDMDSYGGRWSYVFDNVSSTWKVDQNMHNINIFITGNIESISNGDELMAVQSMADLWNWENPSTNLMPIGIFNGPVAQFDNINHITLDDYQEQISFSSESINAVSVIRSEVITTPNACPENQIRQIKEVDIYLHKNNMSNYLWGDMETDAPINCNHDFKKTILHEFGHLLGLGHIINNPAIGTIMAEISVTGDYSRILSTSDKGAIQALYNVGINGAGIISCDQFKDKGMVIDKNIQGILSEKCGDDCEKQCKHDANGIPNGIKITCHPSKNRNFLSNNLGLSDEATANINNYFDSIHYFNINRGLRWVLIISMNKDIFLDILPLYVTYLEKNKEIDSTNIQYANLFLCTDKILNEFMPLIDATFRCSANLSLNPELIITPYQKQLLSNFVTSYQQLTMCNHGYNELAFINQKLNDVIGMNVKQAFEYLITAPDPNL